MKTIQNKTRALISSIVILSATCVSTYALPDFAADSFGRCIACHGTPINDQDFTHPSGRAGEIDGSLVTGFFQVTPQNQQIDLGQQLDGQSLGPLDTYLVAPGGTVNLSIDILDGQVNHAITLFGLQNGGQANSQDNKITYQYAGDDFWITQATYTTPSFNYFHSDIKKDYDTDTYTLPLTISAETPEDTYLLTFGMARLRGIRATYEEHSVYVKVSAGETEPSRLINISTRGYVKVGKGSLIGGFVILGDTPMEVLIQGVGPELAGQSDLLAEDVLADPVMVLVKADGNVANDDWGNDAAIAQAQIDAGANELSATSKSSAILATLDPGFYTVLIAGMGETEGIALVEAYEVPSN